MARFIRHENYSTKIYNLDCVVGIEPTKHDGILDAEFALRIDFIPYTTMIDNEFYTVEIFKTEKAMNERIDYLLSYGNY